MNHSPTEGAQGSANSKTPLTEHATFSKGWPLDADCNPMPESIATPTTHELELIAVNAALLRLFKGEYRNPGDRHSDSLFVREHLLMYHERAGQLAQSEERVALLEGALRASSEDLGFLRAYYGHRWEAHQRVNVDTTLLKSRALLSSSKTN